MFSGKKDASSREAGCRSSKKEGLFKNVGHRGEEKSVDQNWVKIQEMKLQELIPSPPKQRRIVKKIGKEGGGESGGGASKGASDIVSFF